MKREREIEEDKIMRKRKRRRQTDRHTTTDRQTHTLADADRQRDRHTFVRTVRCSIRTERTVILHRTAHGTLGHWTQTMGHSERTAKIVNLQQKKLTTRLFDWMKLGQSRVVGAVAETGEVQGTDSGGGGREGSSCGCADGWSLGG